MEQKKETPFIGYEYLEISVPNEKASFYMNCYGALGWEQDENSFASREHHMTVIRLKRDRKIINKTELTRLQRHFEACAKEINTMDHAKTSVATIWALVIGIVGTAFMAGSVFAVTHEPPIYWLCVLLAVPAFAGWIAPYFVYRRKVEAQTRKLEPMIEAKLEEIYEICEKGHGLL